MLTYYVSNMILRHLTGGLRNSGSGNTGIVLTTDCYIGLFTGEPYTLPADADDSNDGERYKHEVETTVDGKLTGYERQLIGKGDDSNHASSWFNKIGTNNQPGDAKYGKCENVDLIYFPEVLQSWGKISYVGLFDSKTDGHLLAYARLKEEDGVTDATIEPDIRQLPIIRKGQLTLEFDKLN